MKKFLSYLLFASFTVFFPVQAHAVIVETNLYEDVENYLGPDTLVVTDLDNTVLRPPQYLGSDEWGGWRQKEYQRQGYPKEVWIERGVSEFAFAQMFITLKPVEPTTPAYLKSLVSRGIPLLGLTARPLSIVDRTLELLAGPALNVAFASSPLPEQVEPNLSVKGVVIKGGVIFVGPFNNKGLVLKELLQKNHLSYARIVFIDDKAHHVQELETAFAGTAIQYTGLRYGAADAFVRDFDPAIGQKEWDILLQQKRVISDDEARDLLNH